jgi:lipopolysaccharide export system permease protein
MMAISPIGSNLTQRYDAARADLLEQKSAQIARGETGIWLRDGNDFVQTIIQADSIDTTGTVLRNARFIQQERIFNNDLGDAFVFLRRMDAELATLENGFWQLEGVIEYKPNAVSAPMKQLSFSTEMERATLIDRFRSPTHIGFWRLPNYIEASETVGINASKFKMRYQSLLAMPVLFAAMSLIGALACLRMVRLGRTAPLIAFGAGGAIMLYFVNQLGSSFGSSGDVPAIIAAWSPPLFAVFVCLALVAYFEDG